MPTEEIRPGRPIGQGLASSSCLLVLAGLSCTRPVYLPSADSGPADSGTSGARDASVSSDMTFTKGENPGPYGQDQCRSYYHLNAAGNAVEMIIALDRSTSMQQHPFDGMTRLQAAQAAIGKATKDHDGIQFGLTLFPWPSCGGGASCCAGDTNPLDNLESQVNCSNADGGCPSFGSDSPSNFALRRCYEYFTKELPSKKATIRFVLLITDKDPACSADASSGFSLCGPAIDAAKQLGQFGVQTFVVSLGSDANSTTCLQSIAELNASALYFAGDTQFFWVPNQQQLGQQIDSIMTKVGKNLCRFTLVGQPSGQPLGPDQVQVEVNGKNVPRDGYRFDQNPNSLEILGDSCTDLLNGSSSAVPNVSICQTQP